MINIIECDDYGAARNLIIEYSKIKGAESCFISLDKELSDLEGFYKGGALLLGYEDEKPIATIAIKKINDDMAEAKRLYIDPEYRGKGYALYKKMGFEELENNEGTVLMRMMLDTLT